MKFLPLLMMTLGALVVGCERHEFEGEYGTRQLHEKKLPLTAEDEKRLKELEN